MKPTLVGVAHGTRDASGPAVIEQLMHDVGARVPHVRTRTAYVELVEPLLSHVMAQQDAPCVVVPLLLSTGYHVKCDLPAAAALSRRPVLLTRPLGPDRLVAQALADRLRQGGARRGDGVVLAAAGSTDLDGVADVERASTLLSRQWGTAVGVGFVTAARPSVEEAVAQSRAQGHRRVFVAPYLLAPGRFASRVRSAAEAAGATGASDVLGAHRLVVELVRRRYREACARMGDTGGPESGGVPGSSPGTPSDIVPTGGLVPLR